MAQTDAMCARGEHEWKRIAVRDEHGIRSETWECRWCDAVRYRTGHAPTLGDRHRRMD